ncbi:MAG: hypothetical protein A2172_02335 [Candidatus Woykebacteria bacterium RBG_13_40_15]|uniref:N-acetyltransferase domain-containing protein n=1 Tax=Candidatus Woykebacteria bacterium RBG_13_40_15 TaxID=1802593 RepID=A0A1G1W6H3_9BACT|nr:MAG: hypothetical protein A2172_02335 [Candidatus Woykebacteria bacterium RBG_13_40_15]
MEIKVLSPELITDSLLEKINNLRCQLDPDLTPINKEELKKLSEQPHVRLFLAFRDKALVGMLTSGFFHFPSRKKMFIEDVVVDEPFRRQGIGRELSKVAIALVEELAVETIDLTSTPDRLAAHSLYESLGFEKRDTHVYRLKAGRKK